MESWVDIIKGNQISKVPYQAFKDVFEREGFKLVNESPSVDSTFSLSAEAENTDENLKNNQILEEKEEKSEQDRRSKKRTDGRTKRKV